LGRRPLVAVRAVWRSDLHAAVTRERRQFTRLGKETVNDHRMRIGKALSGRPLGWPYVEATTPASKRTIAQVLVKGDHHQISRERILDQRLVILRFDACVAGPDDPVTSSIQQQHHWLDHVLVSQER